MVENAVAWMNFLPTRKFYPQFEYFGRNHFHYTKTSNDFGGFVLPADVFLRDTFARAVISCGFNKFSPRDTIVGGVLVSNPTHLHLVSNVTNFVTVSSNEFPDPSRPTHAVRKNLLLGIFGTPINASATQPGCARVVASEACSPAYDPPWDPWISYLADGTWAELAPSQPFLDTAFALSVEAMSDTAAATEIRLVKMHDALEAAVFDDSSSSKLQTLLSEYSALSADTVNSGILRANARMLRGEIFEREGDYGGALACYNSVVSDFPGTGDSARALNRILHVNAQTADTSFGDVYDSLMFVYRSNSLEGLRASVSVDSSLVPKRAVPPVTGESAGTDVLYGAIPNPATRSVVFRFTIATAGHAKFSLTDARGRVVRVLLDRDVSAGDHELSMSLDRIPPGVYLYRLESGGRGQTRQLVVKR